MALSCYFGHHKCASRWIIRLVHEICALTGKRTFEKQSNLISSLEDIVSSEDIDFYICQTSIYERISTAKDFKAFHVIRDPRDIIVSAYFSHLYTHSTSGWHSLYKHKKSLQEISKGEGLLSEMEYSSYFIDHIKDWNYNDPRILELKMEDLTAHPKQQLMRVLQHLDLFDDSIDYGIIQYAVIKLINRVARKAGRSWDIKLNSKILSSIIDRNNFEKMSGGRKVNEEDIQSHYRKGIPGDWRNHFEQVHLDMFEAKYPGLIEKLGYENA